MTIVSYDEDGTNGLNRKILQEFIDTFDKQYVSSCEMSDGTELLFHTSHYWGARTKQKGKPDRVYKVTVRMGVHSFSCFVFIKPTVDDLVELINYATVSYIGSV